VAGKSRACGGLLRCFSRHSGARRSFLRRKKRIVGGCLRIYVRSSGGDVHNAPSGCRTAEICRMFDWIDDVAALSGLGAPAKVAVCVVRLFPAAYGGKSRGGQSRLYGQCL